MEKNFKDKMEIIYADKPLRPSEQKLLYQNIYKAFVDVLAGILGREPTQREILGLDDLSKVKISHKK